MLRFLSAAAPLLAYDAGETDKAGELAREVLDADPRAAEAHLCLALMALRSGDTEIALREMKACARVRSGEWLFLQLRADAQRHGRFPIPGSLLEELGDILRMSLTPLGPPLDPQMRRADHPFVNVLGASLVRGLGGNLAFFPLLIGIGPTTVLLTEETAAQCRRKFSLNVARLDPRRDAMIVLGADAYLHVRNMAGTRPEGGDTATDADRELMDLVARRHAPIFADVRKRLDGRLFMLGCTPSFNPLIDALALRVNAGLGPVCEAHGVELIDCWSSLADPATGHLRRDLAADAYEGDIHFSLTATPIFVDALKARGALPPETTSAADFEWSSVFEFDVAPGERTRVWCEPSVSPRNAAYSDKIALSHLLAKIGSMITAMASLEGGRTLAIVNARDGQAAVAVPPQVLSGCLAITDSEANQCAARMALDFFGRTDVAVEVFSESLLASLEETRVWTVLLLMQPESLEDDIRRCNAVLARLAGAELVIVATPRPERLAELQLGSRKVAATIPISNRLVAEKWRDYTAVIAR